MLRDVNERPYFEVLDGIEYEKVSPNFAHSFVQKAIARIMDECADGSGAALTELHTRVGRVDGTESMLVPDIAFFKIAAILAFQDEDRLIPPTAPEIAVEIRSPNDRPGLREAKIVKYLATGSRLVLDIDPRTRTVIAHARDGVQNFARSSRFTHTQAPWLAFELDDLFRDLDRFHL